MCNSLYFPVALGLLLGCWAISFISNLTDIFYLFCIMLAILASYGAISLKLKGWLIPKKIKIFIFIVILSVIAGLSLSTFQSYQTLKSSLSLTQMHYPIEIRGTVQGLPTKKDNLTKFEFALDSGELVSLSCSHSTLILKPGDELKLRAVLIPVHNLSNPGSFDTEKHYFVRGIRAVGRVKEILEYKPCRSFSFSQVRFNLFENIKKNLKTAPFKGIMLALIVGDKSEINSSQWQILQKTGTSHLVAISGLHVSLIAGTVFFLVSAAWRRGYRAYERLHYIPVQKVGAIAAILSAFLYSSLAGWSIPTQRAFIMVCAAMLGCLWQRKFSTWFLYCLALILVLIITPLAPLTAGFWLSFLSVGTLIFSFSAWTYLKQTKLQKWMAPQWSVFIGLLPLSFLFFQQATLLGSIANFIAIPVTSFLVVPFNLLGALFLSVMPGCPGLGGTFLKVAHFFWAVLWVFLEGLMNFAYGTVWKGDFSTLSIVFACLGGILLLMPKGLPGKYLGLVAWLPLCLGKAQAPAKPHELWFSLLDVGQGLSAVIQTKHHVLIYDTGPRWGEVEAGGKVIVPFLKSQGVSHIDTIVISHSDLDHRGGLKRLLEVYKPNKILTSNPVKVTESVSEKCQAGQRWQWDGVDFEILSPLAEEAYRGRSKQFLKTNNQSCVLKVSTGQNSVLLTGDIEALVETDLVQAPSKLKSRILVVPHHGSAGSSTQAFIEAVGPDYALFPVGYSNTFGFPKPSIVDRYQAMGIKTVSNASTGMIQFRFDHQNSELKPIFWRKSHEAIWLSK